MDTRVLIQANLIHKKFYTTDDGHTSEHGSITEIRVLGSRALQKSF